MSSITSDMPEWKTSTPPVSPKKGRQVRDKLEQSPNARASCQRCGQKIAKGEERVGIQGKVQTDQGIYVWRPRYYHGGCVSEDTKRKLHLDPPKRRAKRGANGGDEKKNAKPAAVLEPRVRRQLEQDLRGLRRSFAAVQECEEYKIFKNQSLKDMIAKLPTNETELQQCWGIKGKRCSQYGESILRVINFYLQLQRRRPSRSSGSAAHSVNPFTNHQAAASSSAAPSNGDGGIEVGDDDAVEAGPTLSVADVVAQRVRDAAARGEIFEIL